MGLGAEIYNDAGQLIADTNFASLALVKRGTATLGQDSVAPPNQATSASVTVQGEFPFIAYRSPVPLALWFVERSGNTWTFHFLSTSGNAGTPFTWYVFDRPTAVSNLGMQLFDDQGRLTFDLGWPYMRVRGIHDFDANTNKTINGYPAATYAVAMVQTGVATPYFTTPPNPPPAGQNWHWDAVMVLGGLVANSDGFTCTSMNCARTSFQGSQLPQYPQSPIGKAMLIDVTNL
ncbi:MULTISPECIES: hypothetical protein [Luteibacter]|uniref:hypothetical protein n=1 Tax=Luteibacter TaxID=242605 RepID=UPI000560E2B8|nr:MULTISPECIES: hypothetical protein [unclassified Luteibacter]